MARALIIADDCHLAPNDGDNIEVYLCVFISRCVAFVVLDFTAGLSSAPYMAVTPFLRSLLKRIFFLPYAYYLCGCLLFVSSTFFVCVFLSCLYVVFVCLFCVPSWRRCSLLITLLVRSPSVYFLPFFFSPAVFPVWITTVVWFDSDYLVTKGGFVADKFINVR